MDIAKMKAFNAKMGKRQKFSKGGMIRKIAGRHYFDVGGATTVQTATPTTGQVLGGAFAEYNPQFYENPVGAVSNVASEAGQGVQQLASDFTAQNQFQAQLAPTTQYNYGSPLASGASAAQNGYNQFNQNLGQEQGLNQQLGQIASGQGPNPAQTMLSQQTGQIVANQNALMAGQRGASSNVGLIARQAAQQGAATQQQAVGQGATMQAQQSLGALGQEAALQGQIGNQVTSEQNANTSLFGNAAAANNAQNNSLISNYGMAQGINANIAQNNANAVNNTTSGVLNGGASILSALAAGGEVDPGAPIVAEPSAPNIDIPSVSVPQQSSSSGKSGGGGTGGGIASLAALFAKGGNICQGPHKSHVANFLSQGGEAHGLVPAMVSPGERYLNPEEVKKVVENGENPLKLGKKFGGTAKVKGDSLKNDTVPADLEEGGVVIPRHVMNKKSADKAALFVHKAVHMRKPQ
jgi:hypothetical protein